MYKVRVSTNEPARALMALRESMSSMSISFSWDEDGVIVVANPFYYESVHHLGFVVDSSLEQAGIKSSSSPVVQ